MKTKFYNVGSEFHRRLTHKIVSMCPSCYLPLPRRLPRLIAIDPFQCRLTVPYISARQVQTYTTEPCHSSRTLPRLAIRVGVYVCVWKIPTLGGRHCVFATMEPPPPQPPQGTRLKTVRACTGTYKYLPLFLPLLPYPFSLQRVLTRWRVSERRPKSSVPALAGFYGSFSLAV